MKKYVIGVDIGGTNTDVVLLDEKREVLASCKEITSEPIERSVTNAIMQLLYSQELLPSACEAIFLGTTHAINAILQAKDLLKVGLIRLAGHQPDSSPAFFWPKHLQQAVLHGYECLDGGFECHGEAITSFSKDKAKEAIIRLLSKGVESIAVVGCFASINPEQELEVKRLVQELAGANFPLSLSSEIGGIGFLERENATLLNASLKQVIGQGFQNMQQAFGKQGITAPLFMVQNDGSLMELRRAMEMPILTIAAGQTNSFIGGCKVAGYERACVIDIGGTSTDIGVVVHGVPKRSCQTTTIGGVHLQFAMPDVLSLALGGGSSIKNGEIDPKSVARLLRQEAQCFGGKTLTFTDVGVVLGVMQIPGADPSLVDLSQDEAKKLLQVARKKLLYGLEQVVGKEKDLPIVVVGGATALIQAALPELSLVVPPHAGVANAFGAALAEISATTTVVAALGQEREAFLEEVKAKTCQEAILRGADAVKTRIANVEIIPYAYSKQGLAKVSVTAIGPR